MSRRPPQRRPVDPNIADVGALIGDPVRAAMLFALLDGRELPASELAFRAGASPQAASAHLAKLVAGGLLTASRAGRQRLFRLASADVGHAMEAIAAIAPASPDRRVESDDDAAAPARSALVLRPYRGPARRSGHRPSARTARDRRRRERVRADAPRRHVLSRLGRRCRRGAREPPQFRALVHRLDRTPPASRRQPRRVGPRALSRGRLGAAQPARSRAAHHARRSQRARPPLSDPSLTPESWTTC